MSDGTIADERAPAIFSTAPMCSEENELWRDCTNVHDPLWFGLLCQWISPPKPWLMLQQEAGVKERSSYKYAAGDCPRADVLRDIIRSDYGFLALRWIMRGDDPPTWWVNVEAAIESERRLRALLVEIFNSIGPVVSDDEAGR